MTANAALVGGVLAAAAAGAFLATFLDERPWPDGEDPALEAIERAALSGSAADEAAWAGGESAGTSSGVPEGAL